MFLNDRNVVELKGCVACEIHSHEVLLTELLFQNMFSQFEPSEIAALLSCIIFQQVLCVHNVLEQHKRQTMNISAHIMTLFHFLCRVNAVNQILQKGCRR